MNRANIAEVVDELESMGFYKYLSESDTRAVKGRPVGNARSFYAAAARAFDADAEDLAEGSVTELLEGMREMLGAEGCVIGQATDSYSEDGYTVLLDGQPYTMWARKESKQSWELTVKRTADLVNRLLSEASSPERLFLLSGGEDGLFVVLTPALHRLIAGSKAFAKNDIPREV